MPHLTSGHACAHQQQSIHFPGCQVRGSIPLFWIQDYNQRKLKPDILLQRFDPLYDATRLHFQVRPICVSSLSSHIVHMRQSRGEAVGPFSGPYSHCQKWPSKGFHCMRSTILVCSTSYLQVHCSLCTSAIT